MNRFVKLAVKTCLCACVFFVGISCKNTDVYEAPSGDSDKPVEKVANNFNFSTTRAVQLTVDYSAFKTYGPVFFSVYKENPMVNENTGDEYIDESIEPVFEDYTDENGKYEATVVLPSYAQQLYVVTGNFLVSEKVIKTEVVNGVAKAVASANKALTRSPYRIQGEGVSTNDLSTMYSLSYIVDASGKKTDEQIYKEWYTPLGTWNSASGRPDYLLDPATADPSLFFTDEEFAGLYATACAALNSGTTCKESYRSYADLTLTQESEVSITVLGSSTCWLSSLGYYYYTDDNKPTTPMDLNVIMIFPNTQDGQWPRGAGANNNYNGNIGVHRGDVVQLMYYPNIANDGDLSGATAKFPKGTKIGFLLKTNAWGMQGNDYTIINFNDRNRKYNVWGSSTDGLSYCRPFGTPGQNPYQYPNPNADSRTAKFNYVAPNGDKHAIISFEDACNDLDYDDLVFALNPYSAFAELPEVEDRKTTTVGVYAFEDLWPNRGDYDMNDAVVEAKNEVHFDTKGKVTKQVFYLTTYQNYVELTSGLALRLNTKANPSSIVMKKIAPNQTEAAAANFTKEGNVYYLTDDIKGEIGTTYIFELSYSSAQQSSNLASVQPFIYRTEADGKLWEVHIPFEAPTAKMNTAYFGTQDDASVPSEGKYFVREGSYPFAFYLAGVKAESFLNTILQRSNESKRIDSFYPGFIQWSASNGELNADWYLNPR